MTSAAIYREAITAALNADAVQPGTTLQSISEMSSIAMMHGIHHDADMVMIAKPQDTIVVVGLLLGRSIMFGTNLRNIIREYCVGGQTEYDNIVSTFIESAADRFEAGQPGFLKLLRNDACTTWRSFNTPILPFASEVLARARLAGPNPVRRIHDPSVN